MEIEKKTDEKKQSETQQTVFDRITFFYGSLIRGYYHSRKYFLLASIATTTNYEIIHLNTFIAQLCSTQTIKDLENKI